MAISEAQQKAVQRYVAEHYDRIGLTLPKGAKAEIKKAAADKNESVNSYIGRCIREEMARSTSEAHQDAGQGAGYILPPDVFNVALSASERAGEDISDFLYRAVTTQAQRDENSVRLGLKPGQ